jgi:hypothetical protein
MGDGPAAMLQKLAAFRMAYGPNGQKRSPLSQGAFFGLSPDVRRDYGMLNPQYNPQMIELQNERNRINKSQNEWKNPPSLTLSPALQKIQAQLLHIPASFSTALLEIANGIKSAGDPIMKALGDLAQRINAWTPANATSGVVTGGHLPSNPQSGGVGGAKGFSPVHIPHSYPGVRTY